MLSITERVCFYRAKCYLLKCFLLCSLHIALISGVSEILLQLQVFYWFVIMPHNHLFQIYCGITHGRVLIGELYARRLQTLIYLHLSTDCFMTYVRWVEEKSS